jgi:uncharacterized membrane protein YgaE (UPF0421/DUF939 family)
VTEGAPDGVQRVLRESLSPVAETAHASLRRRAARVRDAWRPILQAGVAAGLAWALARLIVGAPDPFFAPAAAVISIGLARGQTLRRSVEVSVGVAIGIGVAFLLRSAVGLGPVQIGGIVALTIVAALLVDASTILANQAAISAVLVMTLPSAALGDGPDRFFDALIGGAVAVLVSRAVLARRPTSLVSLELRRTLSELGLALREASRALESDEIDVAHQALARLRGLDPDVSRLYEALAVAHDAALLSPTRRRVRGELEPYGEAARHVDYAVRNARVLVRSVVAALRTRVAVRPEIPMSLATLAACADALTTELVEGADPASMRSLAIRASEEATGVLALQHDLRTSVIIGQIRATAVDLLRASGLSAESARGLLPPATAEEML